MAAHVEEREIQKKYWMDNISDLSVNAMMLDSKASELDKEERPEILSLLPSYEGKTVLELGAGIGRFTGELAQKASQVVALDFIESAIKKNENINGHYKNVKFMCADVTSPDLNFSEGSVDLIFSNWLLMYLSDKEVENLVERMVKWLKVGGSFSLESLVFINLEIPSENTTQPTTVNPDSTQRFVGYGRKSVQMMIRGSSDS
ncbi:hypothetical protein H0E87_021474 [Populus deltoides]|uniref:phosphoethanolamine N-methyltransferase n=1 Tax=Populus deltoides TaxID=3696 RepID=A0A8T2XFJ2_POPDE|nr:hypothetical protein H0E87_021474 [Populus deltoides]